MSSYSRPASGWPRQSDSAAENASNASRLFASATFPPLRDKFVEPVEIELVTAERERIAAPARDEPTLPERLAQM